MGQILNRLKNLAKVYIIERNETFRVEDILNSENEKLKKEIETLNNQNTKNTHYQNNNKENNINNNYSKKMDLNFACNVLGISESASTDEIKSAYKIKIKEYHPDKVSTLGKELQELAKTKTQVINSAYEFLKKEKGF